MTRIIKAFTILLAFAVTGCTNIREVQLPEGVQLPSAKSEGKPGADRVVSRELFTDERLQRLIDTALANNYDLKAAVQRIEIARANTRMADAARYPLVFAEGAVSVDRYGKYTMNGIGNFDTNLSPNIDKNGKIPNPTPDFYLGFRSTWEADIWGKLKDRKRAALLRYLASQKGRQWLTTQIVTQVASLYYELIALDHQLKIIQRNIVLQERGLEVVEAQMAGGRATALAVRQFRAQVLNTHGAEVEIRQAIVRAENDLSSMLGRFSNAIPRDTSIIAKPLPPRIENGIPAEVLLRRPDIQQAELELAAAKADISAARKALLPSLSINPYVGFNAFKLPLLFSGSSLAAGLAGSLAGPIINRSSIINGVHIANAEQFNAFYNYQRNIIEGYNEAATQIQAIDNLKKAYDLKVEEVQTLQEGVATANDLYLAGYASYLEVIVAQGSVLRAEMEQTNIKKEIFNSIINLYRSLGGG